MRKDQSDLLTRLREANFETIHSAEEDCFARYGILIDLPAVTEMLSWADRTIDPDGPVYVPHYPSCEKEGWKKALEEELAGGMPLEVGSCCGSNTRMNGMEYHKGHEYILALSPLVLFLGFSGDIRRGGASGWSWDSALGRFFFVPGGRAVELYSTTLHLAPCRCGSGDFRSLIILPEGTNLELEKGAAGKGLLFKRNKWMICHPDSPAAASGACPGITGANRFIRPLGSRIPTA